MMTDEQLKNEVRDRLKNAIRTSQRGTLDAWDKRHLEHSVDRMLRTIKTYVRQQIEANS